MTLSYVNVNILLTSEWQQSGGKVFRSFRWTMPHYSVLENVPKVLGYTAVPENVPNSWGGGKSCAWIIRDSLKPLQRKPAAAGPFQTDFSGVLLQWRGCICQYNHNRWTATQALVEQCSGTCCQPLGLTQYLSGPNYITRAS